IQDWHGCSEAINPVSAEWPRASGWCRQVRHGLMAKVAGSIWVEGDFLHFVAEDLSEWQYAGESITVGSPALPGSLWVEGDYLWYVDASSVERRITNVFVKTTTGIEGSVWVDLQKNISWLGSDKAHRRGHSDTPHTDHTDNTHSDATHGDIAHSDSAHS